MRVFFLIVFFVICFACHNTTNIDQKESGSISSIRTDSMPSEQIITRVYEGILPCADCPGIRYDLVLENQEFVGDGTFKLKMTYLEAENGKDSDFESTGKWITLRGDADDINATVYQLNPDSMDAIMNFLVSGDSLIMLDREQKRIRSGLNYILTLKK